MSIIFCRLLLLFTAVIPQGISMRFLHTEGAQSVKIRDSGREI